jgi:hypothetical protein
MACLAVPRNGMLQSLGAMSERAEQLKKIELFRGLKPEAVELIAKVASEDRTRSARKSSSTATQATSST